MEWPTGVRPISLQGLTLFGIGPDDRLYWDGHAIKVERTVSLNWWQNLLAVMTAFGAAARRCNTSDGQGRAEDHGRRQLADSAGTEEAETEQA
jgi:hypothetical protein